MSDTRITKITAEDIRFPTSRTLDGSDAMNPDPDYSAAYCTIHTSDPALCGYGLTFTIGRGTDLCVAAIHAFAERITDWSLDRIEADTGAFWRHLVSDSQLRWLGPEKGVVHLAMAAVVNAVWDLLSRRAGKPLWRYLADMSPEDIVRAIDFRYISDALTPAEALDILQARETEKPALIEQFTREGHAAYTTSAGWLGYADEKIEQLVNEAIADGWQALKVKVGRDLADDQRRLATIRRLLGPQRLLMIDANQVWDVDEAITWTNALRDADPYWIEEPTSPDDVLGHGRIRENVRGIRVATGEHCQNRILFKQFLQADAIDVVQIDACRLGGVNEVLSVLLLAAKYGIPVCPHAGGVGLCEYVQHLAFFDAVAVAGDVPGRMIEHAAHLHEHFRDPIRIENGRYLAPEAPGYSIEMYAESIARYRYPDGPEWGVS